MAERRMFAKSIMSSDAFLDMPNDAKVLYMYLNMYADDDGFIDNPRSIMRMCGASDDSLKLLIAKKFVICFNKGDNFIVVVKHWRINNYIRKDTYHETRYKEFMRDLYFDENQSYSLNPEDGHISCISASVTSPSRVRNESLTQDRLGKDRLGKVSLGKVNDIEPTEIVNEAIDDFQLLWATYPKKLKQKEAMEEFAKVKSKGVAITTLLKAIDLAKTSSDWKKENGKYIPLLSNWLKDERWTDVPIDLMYKKDLKPLPKIEDIVKEKK